MPSSASLIYRQRAIYEAVMLILYGGAYTERYTTLAALIPEGASVLDVCCGPAVLFHRYLKPKGVAYTGLDINHRFVRELSRSGANGLVWNVEDATPLPRAQYVVMQASLYHFLPNASQVVQRLVAAAERQVLIAEPIRNMADSQIRILALVARKLTNPGTGQQSNRFNESRLDALLKPYEKRGQISHARLIAGGREKLYILVPKPKASSE